MTRTEVDNKIYKEKRMQLGYEALRYKEKHLDISISEMARMYDVKYYYLFKGMEDARQSEKIEIVRTEEKLVVNLMLYQKKISDPDLEIDFPEPKFMSNAQTRLSEYPIPNIDFDELEPTTDKKAFDYMINKF